MIPERRVFASPAEVQDWVKTPEGKAALTKRFFLFHSFDPTLPGHRYFLLAERTKEHPVALFLPEPLGSTLAATWPRTRTGQYAGWRLLRTALQRASADSVGRVLLAL